MPAIPALRWCSCGHVADEHAQGGKCRARSAADWPCECPQFDSDDDQET
jgi:hypothetical protein